MFSFALKITFEAQLKKAIQMIIISAIGLLLLVLGILLFNPITKWAIQKWFLAIGILLLIGGVLVKHHCRNSCRQLENCKTNTECHSAKSEKHCANKHERKCEHKAMHGDSITIEKEKKVVQVDDQEFSISLAKSLFEANDRTVFPLTVTPSDAVVTGPGVSSSTGAFTFTPSVAGIGKHKLSVNGVAVFDLEVK